MTDRVLANGDDDGIFRICMAVRYYCSGIFVISKTFHGLCFFSFVELSFLMTAVFWTIYPLQNRALSFGGGDDISETERVPITGFNSTVASNLHV